MTQEIKDALLTMDPTDDTQWTQDGAPTIEAVKALTGNASITRSEVTHAWPEFNRLLSRELDESFEIEGSEIEPMQSGLDQLNSLGEDEPLESVVTPEAIAAEFTNLEEMLALGQLQIESLSDEHLNMLFDDMNSVNVEIENEIAAFRRILVKLGEKHELVHSIRNKRFQAPTTCANTQAYFATQDALKASCNDAVRELMAKGVSGSLASATVAQQIGARRPSKSSKAQRFLNKKV